MKKTLLFCTGESGSGKSYFIENRLPEGLFYKLKSATTRAKRPSEVDGQDYYFRDEKYFNETKLATFLWVNQSFCESGSEKRPKWIYGVPEFEIYDHLGSNLIYDVIQPRYVRDMINWFKAHKLNKEYEFKTLYFLPSTVSKSIVKKRANMPDDEQVRAQNTCTPLDFLEAGLDIDFMIKCGCGKEKDLISDNLKKYIAKLSKQKQK